MMRLSGSPENAFLLGVPMAKSILYGFTGLIAILLVAGVGCGGSGDTAAETDEAGTVPAPAGSDESLPEPGQPQVEPEIDMSPRVEIQTSVGTFTVTLRRDLVPRTVDNFLDYVDAKFYDNTIFHRVIPDYAVLAGNYVLDGETMVLKEGGVGINNEAASGMSNKRGTIAMAREAENADSARCQFFINLVDNTSLDYEPPEEGVPQWQTAGYCAFGKVDGDGMAVVDRIAQAKVHSVNGIDQVPVEPITINSIRRL